LGEGLYAGEAFTESGEGGENHHRIHQDMVWLQVIGVEEVSEEVQCRQTKTPLEMGDEDDSFTGFRCRHSLSHR
jgi:hypothetical protein